MLFPRCACANLLALQPDARQSVQETPWNPQAAFNYDTKAVEYKDNAIIAALPCALKELQKRMTNPFQQFLMTQVRC